MKTLTQFLEAKREPAVQAGVNAVRQMRKKDVRIFHGTSSDVDHVTPQGQTGKHKGTFLSTDPKDARAFAKQAAGNKKGSKPVVFMARASQQPSLRAHAYLDSYDKHKWVIATKPLVGAKKLNIKEWLALAEQARIQQEA